jgi:hypothetical protein
LLCFQRNHDKENPCDWSSTTVGYQSLNKKRMLSDFSGSRESFLRRWKVTNGIGRMEYSRSGLGITTTSQCVMTIKKQNSCKSWNAVYLLIDSTYVEKYFRSPEQMAKQTEKSGMNYQRSWKVALSKWLSPNVLLTESGREGIDIGHLASLGTPRRTIVIETRISLFNQSISTRSSSVYRSNEYWNSFSRDTSAENHQFTSLSLQAQCSLSMSDREGQISSP